MSNDLNLNRINFQSQLRSKIVRDNFTDIENEFNSLRSEVYASIASTASEVTSARDNFSSLNDNIHARKAYFDVIGTTSDYEITNESGLTIRIAQGSGIVNGTGIFHNTSATASVSAPAAGNNRYDVAVLNSDNTRSIVTGTETTGTASIPSIAKSQRAVARWHIFDTTSTLGASNIKDVRFASIDPFQDEEYGDLEYNFSGNTVSNYIITAPNGDKRQYDWSYSGQTIASIGVTIDSVRYTRSYTFSGNTIANDILTME